MDEFDMAHKVDVIDQASQTEELQRRAAMAYRMPELKPCGACWNCSEPLPDNSLFCAGVECRDDYEKREKRK